MSSLFLKDFWWDQKGIKEGKVIHFDLNPFQFHQVLLFDIFSQIIEWIRKKKKKSS